MVASTIQTSADLERQNVGTATRRATSLQCAARNRKILILKSTHAVTEQPDDSLEEYALTIDCVTTPHSNPLMVTVEMDNTPVKMEVDTGAALSIMSYSTFSSTWPTDSTPEVKPTRAKLRTYTGEAITVRGDVDVTVKYGDQEEDLTLVIMDGDGPTLLGRDWLQNLRLDWAALNHITQGNHSELKTLLHAHSVVFSQDVGQIKGTTARLYLKEGSQPRFCRARQVPYALRDKVAKEIDLQVESGILESVKFSHWATPVVPILRKMAQFAFVGTIRSLSTGRLSLRPTPCLE